MVEAITGQRLGQVLQERVFEPLGMTGSPFTLTSDMRQRLARIHQPEADGSLTPLTEFELSQDPEVHMAGHGLYSTVGDYCKFILSDGRLEPATCHLPRASTRSELALNVLSALDTDSATALTVEARPETAGRKRNRLGRLPL